MSASSGKVLIPVESPAEQEVENQKNARKMLKDVQNVATMNKENVNKSSSKLSAYLAHKELTKKSLFTDPSFMEAVELKRKKTVQSQSSQTSPEKKPTAEKTPRDQIIEDLTSLEGPSEAYWEVLAERRRVALEETITENQELYEKVNGLEEELSLSKDMLKEARDLVEVLTEMLQEEEAAKEEAAGEGSSKVVGAAHQVDDSGVVPEAPLSDDDL